jgi:hypothetical protein
MRILSFESFSWVEINLKLNVFFLKTNLYHQGLGHKWIIRPIRTWVRGIGHVCGQWMIKKKTKFENLSHMHYSKCEGNPSKNFSEQGATF